MAQAGETAHELTIRNDESEGLGRSGSNALVNLPLDEDGENHDDVGHGDDHLAVLRRLPIMQSSQRERQGYRVASPQAPPGEDRDQRRLEAFPSPQQPDRYTDRDQRRDQDDRHGEQVREQVSGARVITSTSISINTNKGVMRNSSSSPRSCRGARSW